MTRGRPPVKAVTAALVYARERGRVAELEENSGLPVDFIIIARPATIFVKIKRVRTLIDGPEDAAFQFRSLIRKLRLFPQGPVAFVELWVLSSRKNIQFFRILPGTIIETRSDGETGIVG